MESYHKRKRLLEEKYGKLKNVKPLNGYIGIADNSQQKFAKQLQDITDEEGLRLAYGTKRGFYHHYNKLFIAGTKDFPVDHIDDLKLPFDDTLNNTKRGRDADKYYRSHHEIDTVISHSLGGAVALSLDKQYKQEGNNPYGIVQGKTFGSPTVSGNASNPLLKNIVKDEIIRAGAAGMGYIGASADTAIAFFADGGLLTGIGADICKKVSSDFANRITEDTNTSPDRIRYLGDPISMFDFQATTVIPSFKQRWKQSAHSFSGLQIAGKDTLTPSPDDSAA